MATFKGTNGADILPLVVLGPVLALGNDRISGFGGDDILIGWSGNDTLEGGSGRDILIGGYLDVTANVGDISLSGVDTASYATSSAAVAIDLSEVGPIDLKIGLIDVAVTSATAGHGGDAEGDILVGISNLTGSQFNDTLIGNDDQNVLRGLDGSDRLDGGVGIDTMIGGLGSDIYYVDNSDDAVVEFAGEGTADRLAARVSYALATDADIEVLTTTSASATASINLKGNGIDQTLVGNAGDNVLNGDGGVDVMTGGSGNDTYIVDTARDVIHESVGGGMDRLGASSDYILAADVSVESMSTTNRVGTNGIDLTGNAFGQSITGNAGDNILNGRGGRDTLNGREGDDSFVFDRPLAASNVDKISDFGNGDDTVRLSADVFKALPTGVLSADAFHIGFGAADASDRIIYDHTSGALYYDRDGSGGAAAVRFAMIGTDLAVTHTDFFVF